MNKETLSRANKLNQEIADLQYCLMLWKPAPVDWIGSHHHSIKISVVTQEAAAGLVVQELELKLRIAQEELNKL